MRFSILATSIADGDGNGNNTSSGNGNDNSLENDPEQLLATTQLSQRDADSPRSTAASSFLQYATASPAGGEKKLTNNCEDVRQPAARGAQPQPLESTAMATPVERGAMPYSPIGASSYAGRVAVGSGNDNFSSPLAHQQQGKVVFRVKKLPTSLQMRPGNPGSSSDPVFNARPRAPDDLFAQITDANGPRNSSEMSGGNGEYFSLTLIFTWEST
jgi:hypothetical protein